MIHSLYVIRATVARDVIAFAAVMLWIAASTAVFVFIADRGVKR